MSVAPIHNEPLKESIVSSMHQRQCPDPWNVINKFTRIERIASLAAAVTFLALLLPRLIGSLGQGAAYAIINTLSWLYPSPRASSPPR
jgi:hypothetical protein